MNVITSETYELMSDETRVQVRMLYTQLMFQPVTFTICDFYTVDNTFLASVSSTSEFNDQNSKTLSHFRHFLGSSLTSSFWFSSMRPKCFRALETLLTLKVKRFRLRQL